ncbi:unnamed protein product [Spirodela intermedia]|uniref:Uncharacterized protein n=1 Tax=Spirodela intermedia TaxID=51605 RepID=A0A7I8IFF2_SPIIN|nr:unnamed protein product [Spirodela intermedia]CAA6656115.1 unnamed protein product [Spirodela intermedia]
MMSAQDTTPLHFFSSLALTSSMISNPSTLGLLMGESFSATFFEVELISIDPSQP